MSKFSLKQWKAKLSEGVFQVILWASTVLLLFGLVGLFYYAWKLDHTVFVW